MSGNESNACVHTLLCSFQCDVCIQSYYMPASDVILVGRVRGRQSLFGCPWQPLLLPSWALFIWVASSFRFSSLFFSCGSLAFIKSPLRHRYKHNSVIRVKSIGDSLRKSIWSQYVLCFHSGTPRARMANTAETITGSSNDYGNALTWEGTFLGG